MIEYVYSHKLGAIRQHVFNSSSSKNLHGRFEGHRAWNFSDLIILEDGGNKRLRVNFASEGTGLKRVCM